MLKYFVKLTITVSYKEVFSKLLFLSHRLNYFRSQMISPRLINMDLVGNVNNIIANRRLVSSSLRDGSHTVKY